MKVVKFASQVIRYCICIITSFFYCQHSKNGKPQKRGKVNLIGRLQLSTEKSKEEDNEGIVQLRILRTQVWLVSNSFVALSHNISVETLNGEVYYTYNRLVPLPHLVCSTVTCLLIMHFNQQEAIVKILKMRKKISNAQLQTELVEMLKNMFLPSKKLIKEQLEWLIEHKYMKRDDENINIFIYLA